MFAPIFFLFSSSLSIRMYKAATAKSALKMCVCVCVPSRESHLLRLKRNQIYHKMKVIVDVRGTKHAG